MTLKEKIVFAAYLASSVAIVAAAATEIYVAFKWEHDYNKKKQERLAQYA